MGSKNSGVGVGAALLESSCSTGRPNKSLSFHLLTSSSIPRLPFLGLVLRFRWAPFRFGRLSWSIPRFLDGRMPSDSSWLKLVVLTPNLLLALKMRWVFCSGLRD